MKMKYLFIVAIFVMLSHNKLFSQTDSKAKVIAPPPSDATTGYTYDFNKAQALIIERITKPSAANADV